MAKTPKAPEATEAAPAPATVTVASRTYEAAQLTGVRADIPMPANLGARGRGQRSQYPFDALEVFGSFGVKNKTAKQMASTVSAANRRFMTDAIDEAGNKIFKTQTLKQADGSEITVPTMEVEQVPGRVFICGDVDPATDPNGASVRIWRKQ